MHWSLLFYFFNEHMFSSDADIVKILKCGIAKIIITTQNTLVSFFFFI